MEPTVNKLDVTHFRQAVVAKVTTMVGGKVEDTGHRLRVTGGQYDCAEVELAFRKLGIGYAAMVDGKQVRHIYAGNTANLWTVAGEVMERLESNRQRLEQLRKEREDTEKCLLSLKTFPLHERENFNWNVRNGRAHLEIRASFGPDRMGAFIDMVEMARATLEDGDLPPPASNGDDISVAEVEN